MSVELRLPRDVFTEDSTTGVLSVDATPWSEQTRLCCVLEDRIRAPGVKIHGKTAIPPGRYRVVRTFSQRFRRILPLLIGVPNYSGVRIHSGNRAVDTDGCLCVGLERRENVVLRSRQAMLVIDDLFDRAEQMGLDVFITIENVNPPKELLL